MIYFSRKKGFILVLAIYFLIIAAITSIGMYAYAYYIARQVWIGKMTSTRGYYCAVAGARYAYILLKDPLDYLMTPNGHLPDPNITITGGSITTLPHNGETVTFTITPGSTLWLDLNMQGNDTLTVTIEEWNTGITDWTDGNYRVTATFTS